MRLAAGWPRQPPVMLSCSHGIAARGRAEPAGRPHAADVGGSNPAVASYAPGSSAGLSQVRP
jgi:hypothetical protein